MVDLLVLLTICFFDGMRKLFIATCKGSWWFIKIMFWVGFVPVASAVMLMITLAAFIVCKIFKKPTPRITHTKRWVLYPTWNCEVMG